MSSSKQLICDLDQLIENYYNNNRATADTLNEANSFIETLKQTLQKDVFQEKTLKAELYGSLRNGLWSREFSDVDIALSFEGKKEPKREVIGDYMWKMKATLEKLGCRKILILPKAKVPVVQFEWTSLNNQELTFNGDIVFFRGLSVYNSDLLKAYCSWDPRVAKLGSYIKKWARSNGIGTAKTGYLSSFGWVLMMIHYLQKTSPPVLLNLQQLGSNQCQPELFNRHNVYFYKGPKININGFRQNDMSVAELFVGFLGYYASFNFERRAVAIHRTQLRRRNYIMNGLNIQDPFTFTYFGLKNENCWKKREKVVNFIAKAYAFLQDGRIPTALQSEDYPIAVNLQILEASLFAVSVITEDQQIPASKPIDLFHIPDYNNMTKKQRSNARKQLEKELENDKELRKAIEDLQF